MSKPSPARPATTDRATLRAVANDPRPEAAETAAQLLTALRWARRAENNGGTR